MSFTVVLTNNPRVTNDLEAHFARDCQVVTMVEPANLVFMRQAAISAFATTTQLNRRPVLWAAAIAVAMTLAFVIVASMAATFLLSGLFIGWIVCMGLVGARLKHDPLFNQPLDRILIVEESPYLAPGLVGLPSAVGNVENNAEAVKKFREDYTRFLLGLGGIHQDLRGEKFFVPYKAGQFGQAMLRDKIAAPQQPLTPPSVVDYAAGGAVDYCTFACAASGVKCNEPAAVPPQRPRMVVPTNMGDDSDSYSIAHAFVYTGPPTISSS